jgi:hypothetical protein
MVQAQVPNRFSNQRLQLLDATVPFQRLDSLTVAPPLGLVVDFDQGTILESTFFLLHNNWLQLDTAALRKAYPSCKKIAVSYRVMPYDLGAKMARLDTVAIRRRANNDAIAYDYSPYDPVKKPWEASGLKSAGTYTRGLSFGNSQNLTFNSNLNLQLDGKLGNDLELRAALSDNSIPLQPDGTTRQLQEFDRIFIQLKRKQTILTAGDFDLTRPVGYFSQYFKRLQGTMVESIFQVQKDTVKIRGGVAISNGKFARQIIKGQEGNQGPYRLQGTEGERFIIVLAGTEKVFIDGQLQRRGLEDDYVVDYNLGEIVFTPHRFITKDSRIIVEFEYIVQAYLRSTAAFNTAWKTAHSRYYFNLYSEQDARNNGGAQVLSPTERRSLAEAGDNLRNAYSSGIDTLEGFDPGRVLYRIVDSVVCGAAIPILMYSAHPDSARYSVRFTEVAAGQGHYKLASTAANGRVFRWSPPDPVTCNLTGNYEPIVKLIAPELRQLWAAGLNLQPYKNTNLSAEIALSNRDLNRYSTVGNRDNVGAAGFIRWKQQFDIIPQKQPERVENRWHGEFSANYERTARTFQALNPYRSAEFTRDWNSEGMRDTVAEQIGRAGISLENKQWGNVQYSFGAFQRRGVYSGIRHFTAFLFKKKGWEISSERNFLKTDGLVELTQFDRPKADFSRTFFKKDVSGQRAIFKTGIYAEREKNARTAVGADTLSRVSFWYDLVRVYCQIPEKNGGLWRFGGFVARRNDFAPTAAVFKKSTVANELNINGGWNNTPLKKKQTQTLSWVLTLRQLNIENYALSKLKPQKSYLGKLDYNVSALRNTVALTANYELGSGQSPRIEYNYLLVNPGDGFYTWVDRNRDSILQVYEMEVAVFQDQANYVRVAVTTPDYIRTNYVLFNPSLRIEPRFLWTQPKRYWQRTLSRLSLQSNIQINRRTFAEATGVQYWNPFQLEGLPDSSLVTLTSGWRNTLFINRGNPKWDASVAQGDNRSRLAITTGFDQRSNRDVTFHGRVNIGLHWNMESDVSRTVKSSDNQAFDSRDFEIKSLHYGPKVSWIPSRAFRLSTAVVWKKSQNTLGNKESASQTDWNTELTWSPASVPNVDGFRASTSLRAKATIANIRYIGESNSVVAFSMLEGLQDGKNYLWSLNLDRQISKTVQLGLTYEGRKTGVNRNVHVGRAQVRALF